MSFELFVPNVEAGKIIEERDKLLVLADHCNRTYEGEISKAGETVTVYVAGTPTVYVLEKDATYSTNATDYNGEKMKGNTAGTGKDIVQDGIPDAETETATEVVLRVNKIALFNVKVGDIDARLSNKKDLMGTIRRSIGKQIAYKQDSAIAQTILNFKNSKASTDVYNPATTKIVSRDTSTDGEICILDLIDALVEVFSNREVPDGTQLYLEGSPKFGRFLRRALGRSDEDNSMILKNRKVPAYNDCAFFKTNSVKTIGLGETKVTDHLICRTQEAVTFFDPFMHIEPYRPEKGFTDCLKGFQLFDCGIVLPDELLWLPVVFGN